MQAATGKFLSQEDGVCCPDGHGNYNQHLVGFWHSVFNGQFGWRDNKRRLGHKSPAGVNIQAFLPTQDNFKVWRFIWVLQVFRLDTLLFRRSTFIRFDKKVFVLTFKAGAFVFKGLATHS
jgi:hypothetical protein